MVRVTTFGLLIYDIMTFVKVGQLMMMYPRMIQSDFMLVSVSVYKSDKNHKEYYNAEIALEGQSCKCAIDDAATFAELKDVKPGTACRGTFAVRPSFDERRPELRLVSFEE